MGLQVDLMRDQDLRSKRVLIREDLNVPVKNGVVTSDARIRAALPTIEAALAAGARVLLMSHLGRPVEGECDPQFSLAPVAQHLSGLLGKPVALVAQWRDGVEFHHHRGLRAAERHGNLHHRLACAAHRIEHRDGLLRGRQRPGQFRPF